jgi:hypothetical protein
MEEVGDIVAQAMGITAFRIRVPKRMLSIPVFQNISLNFQTTFLLNKDKAEEMIQKIGLRHHKAKPSWL